MNIGCSFCGKRLKLENIRTFDGLIKVLRCTNETGAGHPKMMYAPAVLKLAGAIWLISR